MSSALSERQARRVQETKDRILNAMREYLAQAESPAITVDDLCERADVARKTFYNHYSGIQQLQLELVGEYVFLEHHCRELANTETRDFIAHYQAYIAHALRQEPFELDCYYRNIMRMGIEAYFQQTAESADLIRSIQQAYQLEWLQRDMETSNWQLPFSASTFFEFLVGIQSCSTVHTAYDATHPFRDDLFDAQDLMQRYFARKKQEQQP